MRPSAAGFGPDGEGDVHAVRGELLGKCRGFERGLAGFKRGGDLVLDGVDGGAEAFARFGRHGAKLLHQLGNFALFAERRDADGLKRGQIGGCLDAFEQALRKRIEIVRFIGNGVHRRSQSRQFGMACHFCDEGSRGG